jgi:hypothetical protein
VIREKEERKMELLFVALRLNTNNDEDAKIHEDVL